MNTTVSVINSEIHHDAAVTNVASYRFRTQNGRRPQFPEAYKQMELVMAEAIQVEVDAQESM